MADLTEKQKLFCKEYMVALNATQAAIRAGYSENSAKEIGCENLTKPNIQEYLEKQMAKRSAKTEITAEYVLETIKETMEKAVNASDLPNTYKGAELLGKHLKLFTDKIDLGGQAGNPVEIVEVGYVTAKDKD